LCLAMCRSLSVQEFSPVGPRITACTVGCGSDKNLVYHIKHIHGIDSIQYYVGTVKNNIKEILHA
jgi:hypothetical protein